MPHPQPHVPLFASDKFVGTQKRGLYGDVINEIDYSVGRILMTLKMEKLEENTIIILLQTMGHGSLMVAIQDLLVFLGRVKGLIGKVVIVSLVSYIIQIK